MIFVPLIASLPFAVQPTGRANPPVVIVSADNTVIDRDCIIRIAPGTVIPDADGNGVLHITRPCTIRFEPGSILRGCSPDRAPDTFSGVGIRIDAQSGVHLSGLPDASIRIEGFKVGLWATASDRLSLEHIRFDHLWRQRLLSTPEAEDQADWLWPHENDGCQWRTNYGAAICIEQSSDVTVRNCSVRHGQNGVILDRVSRSRLYDNDLSFLSGWGLALWRSSDNLISRNAMDFCIRGYSHGVYNRGQDSAGIVLFEQCLRNRFFQNSATHSGDGLFAFAGKEALGEKPPLLAGEFDYNRRGCNDNVFAGNDFSYAAAHGLELTFSFGNRIENNRLVGNGICGIWGGYSQGTIIAGNSISENGPRGGAREAEGGGINIEHGWANTISTNRFARNSRAIALWDDDDAGLLKAPWARANHKGSGQTSICRNDFEQERLGLHLRRTRGVIDSQNTRDCKTWIDADPASSVADGPCPPDAPPAFDAAAAAMGENNPVGARSTLAGRSQIIMTEWGPWDHAYPLVRLAKRDGAADIYELFKVPDGGVIKLDAPPGVTGIMSDPDNPADPNRFAVSASAPGLFPYTLHVRAPNATPPLELSIPGTLIACRWNVTFFPSEVDPRQDVAAWRRQASGSKAISTELPTLSLKFGPGGPSQLTLSEVVKAAALPRDRFGLIATTRLPLPSGQYQVRTTSDDGVRVMLRTDPTGSPVTLIENWTHHGPTADRGRFSVAGSPGSMQIAEFTIEYFELDGYAILDLRIEPDPDPAPKP